MDYDPLTPLLALKMPVLILYGAQDPWVPVCDSVEALRPLAEKLPNMRLRVIEDADHEMIVPVRKTMNYDRASGLIDVPTSPEYFAELGYWLGVANAR